VEAVFRSCICLKRFYAVLQSLGINNIQFKEFLQLPAISPDKSSLPFPKKANF
jgi:hypothetical protein